ncbi:ATP-binding cassette domain-containing protein [Propioniciclava coleopterorum]|uniref:ATP-binding cassette domain-containing protein n=1 Tax=Propioniciclava coleopterorum TaxID=2714937 RepID=A0A6G7Y453_9ACTN|nr:ATP-binding cassette domain-containing protein [Propioniciclava coleopterorum]QIK71563.1 ATP-binding cassette domain-containing protein [Propioniciclava coleopterorum]
MTDLPRHAPEPDDPAPVAGAGPLPRHAAPDDGRPLFREDAPAAAGEDAPAAFPASDADGAPTEAEPAPAASPEHLDATLADAVSEPTRALPPEDAAPAPVTAPAATPPATPHSPDAAAAAGRAAPSPAPSPAVIEATGFGMATHDPAFTGLDILVPAGRFAAVVGAAGTGKSTLLLALTGRMRPVTGALLVGGRDGIRHPGRVRTSTAIARLADLITPEASLTLDDCLTERTLFDAADPRAREANYLHAARLLGLDAPRGTLYKDLAPVDQTRAALALACVRPSTVIVLDDLDYDVTLDEQRALWDGVAALAADGQPVIAATTERSAVHPDAVVIDLEPEA